MCGIFAILDQIQDKNDIYPYYNKLSIHHN